MVLLGDATRPDDAWAPWADVIVTSAALLRAHTPDTPVETLMVELHQCRGATVIVSDGPRAVRALWRVDGELVHSHIVPPTVAVVDSTGAGDVFRAAVARGLVQANGWPQILEAAAAEASAFCSSPDRS
jgi:sugar/nucleoside kinase (ribokinase family)